MSPTNVYKKLCDLIPGITVTSYKKWNNQLNSIAFIPQKGPMMVFTYIDEHDWDLRTIKYERRQMRHEH